MKIVITSRGEDLDAEVDPRFGRAQYFILFETDDDSFSVLDNKQNLNAPQGAGIQAAQHIIDAGAAGLITGNCGPKAFQVLSAAGIPVYLEGRGTVKETIETFKAGTMAPSKASNRNGHWV